MIMKNRKNIDLKSFIGIGIIAMTSATTFAQESGLYDHTTPIEPYIIQYRNDLQAINYFYGPMPKGWGFQSAAASPEQIGRLLLLDQDYEKKLQQFDYKKLNTNGQVDYILLNRKIK